MTGMLVEHDEQLIERINAGDLEAFETLYYRYRDWAYRLARRFTGNADTAQDVVQETFIYLLKKFPGFSLTARMTTFLYPMVRGLSRDWLRKTGVSVDDEAILSQMPAPERPGGDPQRADLAAVLSVLPAAQREVVLMRYLDEMTLEEIAAALDIPLGTVKSRMHNALQLLRQDERTRRYFFD